MCRSGYRVIVAALAGLALAGCTEIVRKDGDELVIDVGSIGEIMPRARGKIAWPAAHAYCDQLGKVPRLQKLQGRRATYRCIDAP